jgi:glycine dehydrogenase subunit 2
VTAPDASGPRLRTRFHQAAWDEPLVMSLGRPGRRGVIPPSTEREIADAVGDSTRVIPDALRRTEDARLPELSQPQVLRHFTRLSQMALGNTVTISLGLGTTTMKYNPPVNEILVRSPKLAELHPQQDLSTVQGLLRLLYEFEQYLKAISGMARFTFQPGGGSQGILANALMIKAYHASRGDGDKRDEIVSTIFSHPANGAAPSTAGFKVVTLYPGPKGYPDVDALRSALSERTAGLMITNPEDTGIFNPHIAEFVALVHEAGGLCAYDQANANGILGVTRARDAGFDLCHFNLHKTFSVPHGSMGGAVGAVGVREGLEKFLPRPLVERDGDRYSLDLGGALSIGTLRAGLGNVHSVVKSLAWAAMMGADGLKETAHISVLNNNYLASKIARIRGASIAFGEENRERRLEQVRYSWEQLHDETGVGTMHVHDRMSDFGVIGYFTSHHPWLVPEPFTLEPAESYSQEDLDEVAAVLQRVSEEAYTDPDAVRSAPHRSTSDAPLVEGAYARPAMTWNGFVQMKQGAATAAEPVGESG